MLVSPYFVPGKHGVQWFRALRERGVKVTVLRNSLAANDVAAVHAGYRRYREPLLKAGVEFWEVKPTAQVAARADAEERRAAGAGLTGSSRASLRAAFKTFAFDRRVLFIGSLNLDPRSVMINTEIGVLFENPQLATALVAGLEQRLPKVAYRVQFKPGTTDLEWLSREDGAEVRYDSEPQATSGSSSVPGSCRGCPIRASCKAGARRGPVWDRFVTRSTRPVDCGEEVLVHPCFDDKMLINR
ncbi:MAG: phospholipase D-like domain-containing protein [Chromatiales bacterium]|nr:phospholipase D-like domain-containing protein [Chromatiales bacterium]